MKFLKSLLVFCLLMMIAGSVAAQCSMCKTSVESDLNNGGSIANGLNTGILYLMAIPYLILMTGGYFFFKKDVDARLRSWKSRLFHKG